jgi:hypothetical protein
MSWDGYNTSITANRFQKAFIIDYVDLSGRLVVSNGDASLNNRLFVMNDASFMSNVYVDDLLTSNLKFVANGDASLNNRLFVMNDASLNGNVFFNKDISTNGNIVIGRNLTVNGNLAVKNYQNQNIINTTTTNYQLIVSEDLSLNGRLVASGDSSFNGNIYTTGFVTAATQVIGDNSTRLATTAYTRNLVDTSLALYYTKTAIDASVNTALALKSNLASPIFTGTVTVPTSNIGNLYVLNDMSVNTITVGRGPGGVATNAILGYQAGFSNSTGSNNMSLGYQAGYTNTTGANNVCIGNQAGYSNTVSNNVYIGYQSGYLNSSGQYNAIIGTQAAYTGTTAENTTAIGYQALYYNTQHKQVAVGFRAMYNNTIGGDNIALGYNALYSNQIHNSNTAIGYQALYAATANYNTAVGPHSLEGLTTGTSVTAVGYSAGGANTTGSYNTYLGHQAGSINSTGSNNTYIGSGATADASGYSSSTAIGVSATITSSNQVMLATSSQRVNVPGTLAIGITTAGSAPLHVATSGTIVATSSRYFTSGVSSLSATSSPAAPAAGIYTTGSVVSTIGFYASSDSRIKKNILDATDLSCSHILQHLKPKIFNFVDTKNNSIEPVWGFIAQEVKEIMPNAITFTKEYITNFYEIAELHDNIIILTNKTTADLLKDEAGYYKLKIFNTDEKEKIVTIKEIIDEKRFTIESEEPIETENDIVFIYGQEVPDFHSLDKDMIFTLTTAVVKEIDNDLRITKERVKILEEENATLKQELKYVIKRLENAGF